ncbi:MAG: zinc ABC transporter substrate-binding protein, partial [Ornithinimicrobium sp.]
MLLTIILIEPHTGRRPLRPHPAPLVLACTTTLALSACGADSGADSGSASDAAQSSTTIIASFYPLQFIAERVAGDLATVDTLTASGAEPHDVELSPRAVGSVGTADLVLYSAGLQ